MTVETPRGIQLDGAKLRLLRRRRALSQHALATASGISAMTIGRIERGEYEGRVRPLTLECIAGALAVNPAALLPTRDVPLVECPSCGAMVRARMADQ